MGYTISSNDVMTAIITLGGGIFLFLIKRWFVAVEQGTREIKENIKEINKRLTERIDRLEEKTEDLSDEA